MKQHIAGRWAVYFLAGLLTISSGLWASYNLVVHDSLWSSSPSVRIKPNNAIATFLTAPTSNVTSGEDHYFTATRMLAYQLLHDPDTRTRESIPFVVVVTPEVAWSQRAQLEREGAIVIEVPLVNIDWIHPGARRWRDMMTKLRVFQLTQFDRILFIDADGFIVRNIDAIFEDEAIEISSTLPLDSRTDPQWGIPENIEQPEDYLLAGNSGSGGLHHSLPPLKVRFLNGGFFLFRPSYEIFDFYMTVANKSGSFDAVEAEQALLNHVHSWHGNMPWRQLDWRWNINWPTWEDYEAGYATLHTKYWDDKSNDPRLFGVLQEGRMKMERYWARYGP